MVNSPLILAIVSSQLGQEYACIGAAGLLAAQHETVASAHIDGPEENAPGVASGKRHPGLLADPRPSGTQGRQQAQPGPVGEQQHIARGDLL